MTLDDRLRTVLNVAIDGDRSAIAQYRQLVDLLGSGGAVADGHLTAAAYLRLSVLSRRLPAAERIAAMGETGGEPALRLRSAPLVAQLCEYEIRVGEAALDAADLDDAGWAAIVPTLVDGLRRRAELLRMKARGDRRRTERERDAVPPEEHGGPALELVASPDADQSGPPDAEPEPDPGTTSESPPAPPSATPIALAQGPATTAVGSGWSSPPPTGSRDIAGLVRRIEAYREQRAARRDSNDRPIHDGAGAHDSDGLLDTGSVDCRISPEARITWSATMAPMLVGLTVGAGDGAAALDERAATALRRQQVVRGGRLAIEASPAISGDWRLDAVPRFDAVGRFLGHHARLTRAPEEAEAADPKGDEIRQALHELRTPLGALQGFAEIIQQQLFGQVPHRYRAQAADIAAESARLLAGLEEIERLVRLRNGDIALTGGETALDELMEQLVGQFAAMHDRQPGFVLAERARGLSIPLDRTEAEAMLWRLLATLAAASAEGETLGVEIATGRDGELARIAIDLPKAMQGRPLFDAQVGRMERGDPVLGMLGAGFAMRLVAAEARAAGGRLSAGADTIILQLPLAENASGQMQEDAA